MKTWTIKPLYYGKITGSKSITTPGRDADLILDCPYAGFLLQDGRRNVLVDTGIDDCYIVDGKAWASLPAEGGRAFVEKALSDNQLTTGDIDTIVFTHLHNDHAGNLSIFENANPRLVFQKDEWKTLLDPLPVMNVRGDYNPEVIHSLKRMSCLMVEGDMELLDGIRLFKTPGHTAGSQSIQVRTENGHKVICGDHFNFFYMAWGQLEECTAMDGTPHRITPAPDVWGRFIPSTIIYNHYDFYESSHKIIAHMEEDSPKYLLPGHETSLFA